ncbi:MAG: N-6 DNA methylase, partial [Thermoleophilaceae bacterium]|nr:N-6 DNA methylase [Thermoleophilaceae bacterium]
MSPRRGQLALGTGPAQSRTLFSEDFLADRLPSWPEFEALEVGATRDEVVALWERERTALASANEAQTEERFIQPILRALGFSYTVQVGVPLASGRRQPDYALFLDDERRREADHLSGRERFTHAAAVADAKRFDRPLDRVREQSTEAPVAQIVNYLFITRCRWAILTNGRVWRLYAAAGDLVEEASYEVDLVSLLESGDERAFRYFAAFFSADAFRADATGRSFLDRALAESAANAVVVGGALERQIFSAVPRIAEGLLGTEDRSEAALGEAFDNALVLLYRVLFCLHAEARGLLPLDNPHYERYSLRSQKEQVARDIAGGRRYSAESDDLYNDLRALFRIVDRGDEALGVAEYDGGLFAPARHPYFEGRSVPDSLLAPALDALYRVGGEFVDYRELSVRHLGTIYERLLQYRLAEEHGVILLAEAPGRRTSGSYFTPEQVVDSIVERTLEPILEKRSRTVAAAGLSGDEALEALLELRVLDPAMGSAHFLVGACSYIAQYVATDPSYGGGLELGEIQRLVAERCLYGVDLNPLAVELARLALWLTTAEPNEPLTFLHNLREGNSLVGADLRALLAGSEDVFAERLAREAESLIEGDTAIASRETDVHEKERLASASERLRAP